MDDKQRLNLQEMVNASDAVDNTSKIRQLKHSRLIRDDVETLMKLKKKYTRMATLKPKKYEAIIISHCNFLFTNYTNIFNRIMKDELNMNILRKFIETLREVEDGKLDQHEASVKIGEILKELYIDSALQREQKLDEEDAGRAKKYKNPTNDISWSRFKKAGMGD
jgi:RecG-like helicase